MGRRSDWPPDQPDPKIELAGEYINETEQAWCIDFGEDEYTWIPKSQCDPNNEGDPEMSESWWMPEWLAMKKGLI